MSNDAFWNTINNFCLNEVGTRFNYSPKWECFIKLAKFSISSFSSSILESLYQSKEVDLLIVIYKNKLN